MKKAVIAYLLAVLIISAIGLGVVTTVADDPGDSDGGADTQDENGGGTHTNPDPQLMENHIWCANMLAKVK